MKAFCIVASFAQIPESVALLKELETKGVYLSALYHDNTVSQQNISEQFFALYKETLSITTDNVGYGVYEINTENIKSWRPYLQRMIADLFAPSEKPIVSVYLLSPDSVQRLVAAGGVAKEDFHSPYVLEIEPSFRHIGIKDKDNHYFRS